MQRKNFVKTCAIIGFFLAEIYMAFAVLAPNRPEGGFIATRMLVPAAAIPKEDGIAPGAKPPASAVAMRLLICSLFFGPFGLMVGTGVGLLIEGARHSLPRQKKDEPRA